MTAASYHKLLVRALPGDLKAARRAQRTSIPICNYCARSRPRDSAGRYRAGSSPGRGDITAPAHRGRRQAKWHCTPAPLNVANSILYDPAAISHVAKYSRIVHAIRRGRHSLESALIFYYKTPSRIGKSRKR